MKNKLTVSLLLSFSVIFTLNGFANEKHSKNTHWGYEGKTSPKHWGKLKEEFALCSSGKKQSPINIIATDDKNIPPLDFSYKTNSSSVINNGHTVQINIKNGSNVIIDHTKYELKQFHFHTPSENNINGKSYPLEAHFVHATKDGKLAVVAVMFKYGKSNPIIDKIWSKFPLKLHKKISLKLSSNDIKSLLPKNKEYYKFMGSLTAPPCSEQVKWNVFKTPLTISKKQVKKFFDILGHSNNRPLQDTNNRTILK